jgi:hypothetical protein
MIVLARLLPDQIRVLGSSHSDTLATRASVAYWTGEAGVPAKALRLYNELLPEQIRILGTGHPDTLATRASIAYWTGEAGDPAEALRLYKELLPDRIRVFGGRPPRHLERAGQHRLLYRSGR